MSIHILHLEDNPSDAELIKATLERDGVDFEITNVDDRERFEQLVMTQSFDLILADYTLPAFDGLSALKIAKEYHPLIPFILVSGTLGEEVATESLKNGATDYVLKSNLARLKPAVVRALKEADDQARRFELEKRLQQAQKMEAIGTLAGGIAHDFNNILTAILGFGELALEDARGNENLAEYLHSILRAGNRARDLVQQILSFSRNADYECKPILLQSIIKEVTKLLRASLPATIRIEQEISPECGPVLADPTQMHQVIMNLCTNSFHAMREGGGTLKIVLTTADVVDDDWSSVWGLAPGTYLKMTVSDTGAGMGPATLERMYDPYFTTKKQEEGTGLGMAVVHGILTSMRGGIIASSTLGSGTQIDVYFPRQENSTIEKARDSLPEEIPGGKERIFVVDDEADLAILLQDMLVRMGYQVTIFTDPEAALKAIKGSPNGVDLVITDMTMPSLSGAQLAEELLQLRPELPIILYSGYSDNINRTQAREMGISDYLIKPISRKNLGEAVRNAIDQN